jgi:pantoate--beta-alanine ligase
MTKQIDTMSPVTAHTAEELRAAVATARQQGKSIGLVPTMGALHAGHVSLLRLARAETGFVVATIFVNPTQFGPHEDFARYPRTRPDDLRLCGAAGVDLVFVPEVSSIYPPGFATFVEVTGMQDVLEGAARPGHFRGVCTVVLKLFNLAQPDWAYFGQKDAQQVCIIRQMVRDLHLPVAIRVSPTVREPDGLALSSRNRYLDPTQRRHAPALYAALEAARARLEGGERDPETLRRLMTDRIAATPGAILDYAAVVEADTLAVPQHVHGPTLLTLAVKFGGTRLIDNLLVNEQRTTNK